ncbi:MAG: hypothetical protein GC164_05245 [Phycisphaera sp.]|nr:hypothetical protein [Phycisphaera sp.]
MLALAALLLAGCGVKNSIRRQRGIEGMQSGNLEYADENLTLAVHNHGGDWKALLLLGKLRLMQQRPLDAQLLLERALEIRPKYEGSSEILDNLAEALYQQQEYAKLTTFVNNWATQRGGSDDYLRAAKYLALSGDADGAEIAYAKAARFAAADDDKPYLAMAEYYRGLGDKKSEILSLRRAYTINPQRETTAARLRELGLVPGPTIYLPAEFALPMPTLRTTK